MKLEKIKQDKFESISKPLENDLLSFFRIIEEDIMKKDYSEYTADEIIKEIDSMFIEG